jgi:hypothetical protein
MLNYTKKDKLFDESWYYQKLLEPYKPEKLSRLAIAIKYVFKELDLSFIETTSDQKPKKDGRPNADLKGCIQVYFLATMMHISLRDVYSKATPGSEIMYLLDGNDCPKKTTFSKIAKILDVHINRIFEEITKIIEKHIKLDTKKLYCDGTPFEAHNSRFKIITNRNAEVGKKKWENKLPSSPEEKEIVSRIKKWEDRGKKLEELNRNSYGLTDNDCIVLKDKDNSYIAGYNVQLIEEANYGLIVGVYVSNLSPDVNAFKHFMPIIIKQFSPKYLAFDAGYDSDEILSFLYSKGVEVISRSRKINHTKTAINELSFCLTEDEKQLVCPSNRLLIKQIVKETTKTYNTKFISEDCSDCTFKAKCTPNQETKVITFNIENYRNLTRLSDTMNTKIGDEIYYHRGNICESPNGFMKHFLQGKKLKRNGLIAANTTIKILALGFNLTRFSIKFNGESK